jgi:hypothetical protein
LSFVQRFVTIILDCGEVNEHVLATVNLDEAKTLLGVEPLDFAFSQCSSPFFKIVPLSKDATALQYSPFLSRVLAVLFAVELESRDETPRRILFSFLPQQNGTAGSPQMRWMKQELCLSRMHLYFAGTPLLEIDGISRIGKNHTECGF